MSTTAVTVYDGIKDPLEWIKFTGEHIAKSGMFGCSNVSQGVVFAMELMAKRMPALSLAERYHVIFGKLSMKSDTMLADFRTKIGGEHKQISRTAEAAEIELILKKEKHRYRFTWEEAQQEPFIYEGKDTEVLAKLAAGKTPAIKAKYATPRSRMQMLWARVVSDGVRAMAPEIIAGCYAPEEIADMDGVIDVQADPVVEAPREPIDVEALMRKAAGAPASNVNAPAGEIIIDVASKPNEPIKVTTEPAAATSTATPETAQADLKQPAPTTADTLPPASISNGPDTTAPSKPDNHDPQADSSLERIDASGIASLKLLATQAKLAPPQVKAMIEMYAGRVGAKFVDLTPVGGQHMAERLRQLIMADLGNKQPSKDPEGAGMQERSKGPTNGHITPTQIDQIRTITADLAKVDQNVHAKVQAGIKQLGADRLEDLTKEKAAALLEKLYAKAAMHAGAGGKMSEPAGASSKN